MRTLINIQCKKLLPVLAGLLIALPFTAQAAHHEEAEAAVAGGMRAAALTVEAVVTNINLETRQVSLEGPDGVPFTITATEQVVKLEDVSVGDTLVATYLSALEAELRAPTEEELAEPWVVLADAAISEDPAVPAIGGARQIRAVCTIEGMNRVLGTVMLKDPNGNLHVLGDVEPHKMEGVTLGQTLVVVYTEALAISLEHKAAE
jgi:hypothetical protein